MFLRILSIVFPIFIIVMIGFVYGRLRNPDMAGANGVNMAVFLPALIFSALAGKTFNLADNAALALGAAVVVLGSGVLAWPLARALGYAPKTFVPPVMFNNSDNMGLPLIALAFGPEALGAAVGLGARELDMLVIFGALPPAVSNFIFAERYGQESDKVASMVLIGNAAAVLFVPLALALRL